jgi:alkylation response protein AidB-like acyl-CoA dehydrogenase
VPKHGGITYFALPMHQDGVEVRPLRQMNGRSSFNEVFITEARVPAINVVGDVHGGWAVALTTLAHERGLAAGFFGGLPPSGGGRTREEALAEATSYLRTYEWYPQRAGRADLVPGRAAASGVAQDPVIRQVVAHLLATERTARWTADRASASRRSGRPPGAEGSIGKLAASLIAREAAAAHSTIAGAGGMLSGPDSPEGGIVAEVLVSVPGASIAGGTDEVQHNIIGERVLGLPKEPSVDADVPFREVKVNRRGAREDR